MFALTHVALLASTLFAAQGNPPCSQASYGSLAGRKVQLATIYIPAGSLDNTITIPQGCLQSETQIGTEVSVCDDDIAPNVYMTDLYTAIVHRRGSAANPAPVTTWLYCQ